MYKKQSDIPEMANLPLFIDRTLNPNNRWVKLATIIPWGPIDEIYAKIFKRILARFLEVNYPRKELQICSQNVYYRSQVSKKG